MNVFCYGSMMFREVWDAVVGKEYLHIPAVLSGFSRRKVSGQPYPCVIESAADNMVYGKLYLDVECRDVRLIDTYEGDSYKRIIEQCRTIEGSTINAYVYVFREEWRHLVENSPWDPAEFSTVTLQDFISDYEGFRKSNPGKREKTNF
jgi:hypothetical protein